MTVTEQEKLEIERSALDAKHRTGSFEKSAAAIARYANPPVDTPYALEYSFHLLPDVRGLTVLDYGCGAGENLVHLASRGARAIGLDISPDLIELAKKRADAYGVKAECIVGSAYDTGLPSQSVDVVFCIALLHHLDLKRAREEMRRILKPNGIAIVQEPVRDSKLVAALRPLFPAHKEISEYEYPLTREQLDFFSEGFVCDSVRRFRLPFVPLLERTIPGTRRSAYALDGWLLRSFPFLGYFATSEVRRLTRSSEPAISQ